MRKYIYQICFGLIVIVGLYLRVTNIANVPPHLGNDEVSIAFDSYSVANIGRDEHGKFMPLSFISHRTYKAPLYAYLNVPFVKILGNNEMGIRYLSVVSGVILIVICIYFGKEFLGKWGGLMAGVLMAFNPRSITVSRVGYEANLAVWIMTAGVWWMYKFKKTNKNIYVVLAGLFLGLSIWGYHTQWGLAPLLAIVLPWIWRKEINWKNR